VRCSSLVDWPVYPRLAHTMRASNDAQCGTNACVRRPRSVARRPEIARAVEKAIEVTPQGWADRGAGRAARPLRWCKKEGNGRLGASEPKGFLRSERALTPRGQCTIPHSSILQRRTAIWREARDSRLLFHAKDLTRRAIVQGLSTKPRFEAHDDHPLALQLEGAVGFGHQHLDDGAGAPVAERVELAVGERNGRAGRFRPVGSGGGAVLFVIVVLLGGFRRIRRPNYGPMPSFERR
jgi:hypothetical protein